MDELKVFSGRAHPALSGQIADYLGVRLGQATIENFPDGEVLVRLNEDVRGRDVFIVQPTCAPGNDNLMELLIFIDCARRASAERITAVVPYFGYARQDRKDVGRVPISAKLVANLITTAGTSRVLTMDLHAAQVQGFFDIPVDNLIAEPILSRHFADKDLGDLVLVSPDAGNAKCARRYANRLGGSMAIIDKQRVNASQTEMDRIIGDVRGKTVLMMDDMITTGGTVAEAARLCKAEGSGEVYVGATHGVLSGPAVERLSAAPIEEVVVTNSIPVPDETVRELAKLTVLPVADLIGEAIHRIHHHESISSLFV